MLKKNKLTDPVFSMRFKLLRFSWNAFYWFFIRFSPTFFFTYRALMLRMWGANISMSARVYPTAKIWWPANLKLGYSSTIGPRVEVYNQGNIIIGDSVIISQGAYLCASTHNYNDALHPLVLGPIQIKDHVWVCTEAFIGPNIIVSEACVIGARAVLTKNTDKLGVYAGNPAIFIKSRELDLT